MPCEKVFSPASLPSNQLAANQLISAPLNMKLILGIPIFIMVALALFEPSNLDLWLADMMYHPGTGFIGKKSFFLEDILHDKVKQAIIGFLLLTFSVWLASFIFPSKIKIERRRWLYVVVAMLTAASLVTPLKEITEVQCPWSLSRYGGVETYSSVMDIRAPFVKKSGQCWPGGHSSSGFVLFALFFALRDVRPRAARIALASAITLGTILSLSRMLQGAHFLSHNIWTALIDWTICALLYYAMLYKSPEKSLSSAMLFWRKPNE